MKTINCLEKFTDSEQNLVGSFLIEPLEVGQGITIGNTLRRTLLSDLSGLSITGVRINKVKHEFASIAGVREDPLEILMNLKEINFKGSFHYRKKISKQKHLGILKIQGPTVVTAAMFRLEKNILKIINPTQYICTIVDQSTLYIEIDIEKGQGYRLLEEKQERKKEEIFCPGKPVTLHMDAIFTPIRRVNYKIRLVHDTYGNLKESLFLQIATNGTVTPERTLQESLSIILNLFTQLFLTSDIVKIGSELAQEIKNK